MTSSGRFWLGWGVALALAWAALAWGAVQWNLARHTQLVSDRLLLLGELRRGALLEYFATAEAELRFWSSNPQMTRAQAALFDLQQNAQGGSAREELRRIYVQENPNPQGFRLDYDGPENGSPYDELHLAMHPLSRLFVTERGYYDFFLISPDGDVLYTVEKEADFATNLETGEWQDTGLAEVFRRAMRERREGTIAVSDMGAYEPSGGAPAIFMATAINDGAGEFLGVVAFQLPTDRILGIMSYTSGMGETGETYLVGQDRLMRSDSRFSAESTVLRQRVDTATVNLALDGEEGAQLSQDYRNVEVMSAYLPVQVGDARWAVIAEVDSEEIQRGAARERPAMAGLLSLFYGLSLWSVWYWRGRPEPGDDVQVAGLDLSDGDGAGFGD